MQKQMIEFAVITNQDGVVVKIGKSVILQPTIIKKSNSEPAKKK